MKIDPDSQIVLSLGEMIATIMEHASRHGRRITIITSDSETDSTIQVACLPISNERTAKILKNALDGIEDTTSSYVAEELPHHGMIEKRPKGRPN